MKTAATFSKWLSTKTDQATCERYRAAAERAGRPLPGTAELNLLFHTAESARCAHCILFDAMAVLNDGAAWAIGEIMDYERWLEKLRPPLAE